MGSNQGIVATRRKQPASAPPSDGSTDPIVSVTGLEKVYGEGDDAVVAVDGIDLDVYPGTVVGILGPNGAGKTTAIKSILGLIIPTAGTIRAGGSDVHDDPHAAHRLMGAMLEGARNTYWRLTVRENVEMFSVIGGNDYRERSAQIDGLLEQFDLEEKADTVVRELSRGQQQKVSLVCTLARDTEVVFLDEPTLGLDVESTRRLKAEIRRLANRDGRTVVLSSHDMDVVQDVCDRVIVVNNGEIIADDTVENLVDLFNTTTYEVEIAGTLDPDVERELAAEFLVVDVGRDGTSLTIETDGEQFFRLTNMLERAGVAVESFTQREPDFDDVFLRITGRSDTNERPVEGTPSTTQ
ncbi:ABC transporter ATP-binding protein [Natronorubrum sp. DTA28]|uniref:ABC transporter ATP-binding protein n=1 Tax=Natronorubrum sp. DTA28 TaxID=3447019 RepID=UPI003F8256A3